MNNDHNETLNIEKTILLNVASVNDESVCFIENKSTPRTSF